MDFVNWLKSQRDRVVAWLLIAIGGLCILGGWLGVTNTVQVYNQLTYLVSGAIVGLFFLGVGIALLLSADFHDEWRKLDRIEAALRGRPVPEVDEILDLKNEERAVPSGAGRSKAESDSESESVMMASALPAGAVALPVRRELAWVMPGLVVSMVLIAVAWIKSTNSTNAQVGADALLIAVYGIFACGIGVALHSRWLRQSLAQRKGELLGPLLPTVAEAEDDQIDLTATDGTFYVSDGGKRYHRASCAIVASQKAVPASSAQVARLVACELCNTES